MKIKYLFKITILPILILLLHFLLYKQKIYVSFPFLDIPMHFFWGCSLAISFIFLLKSRDIKINKKFKIMVVLSFVIMILIQVEFLEFILFSPYRLGNLALIPDTIKDLFVGSSGGFMVSILDKK